MLLLQDQGIWLRICAGACPLPWAHKLSVELFSLKQLLKIIIHFISLLSLHLSDFPVCLFIYLLDVACGGAYSSALLGHSPQISVAYNSNTHIQFLQLKFNHIPGQFSIRSFLFPCPGSWVCRLHTEFNQSETLKGD